MVVGAYVPVGMYTVPPFKGTESTASWRFAKADALIQGTSGVREASTKSWVATPDPETL